MVEYKAYEKCYKCGCENIEEVSNDIITGNDGEERCILTFECSECLCKIHEIYKYEKTTDSDGNAIEFE